jgi:hypothetical protein
VLLASGAAIPISQLKPGDTVLATNTRTGKTEPETVAAVQVNHDTDLYDLKIGAGAVGLSSGLSARGRRGLRPYRAAGRVDHVGIADAVVAHAPGRDREQRVQGQLALPAVVGVQTGRQLQGAGKTDPHGFGNEAISVSAWPRRLPFAVGLGYRVQQYCGQELPPVIVHETRILEDRPIRTICHLPSRAREPDEGSSNADRLARYRTDES